MSKKIEIPLGSIIRLVDEDGFRYVACVSSLDYHDCGGCVFRYMDGSCQFACCMEDRSDKKEVSFVAVADWKGGKE